MAVGPSAYTINKLLDCLFNNTTFTGLANAYMQLHNGDPGAAGTANTMTETSRQAVSCSAASGGAITNDAIVQWVGIEAVAAEDATHFSLWDAASGGNFLGSGLITAGSFADEDTYTIAVGEFDLAFSVAS